MGQVTAIAERQLSSGQINGVARNGMAFGIRGQGRPIVFIHGWCLSRRMWLYAEDAFSPDYQVILPDLAGFGRSEPLSGPYSLPRYAADVAQLLEELDLRGAVVVGFAFGAAVALELAARYPERIAGVVSVGIPSAACSPYEKMMKAMRRDWPDFARRSAVALFHNPQSAATLAWLENLFAAAALPVAIETVGVLSRYEPFEPASAVRVPQLYIHAEHDTVAPEAVGRACIACAPNARMEIVAGSGHLIVLDGKARFHELVGEFVRSLPL